MLQRSPSSVATRLSIAVAADRLPVGVDVDDAASRGRFFMMPDSLGGIYDLGHPDDSKLANLAIDG